MGVHRERLAALKAHRRFVDATKSALQNWALEKLGRQIPLVAISPKAIDAVELLPIPVPPMLEEALGYRGALRFVQFGYSRITRRFVYSDGGDDIPGNESLWIRFVRHRLIAPLLAKSKYPTLHAVFPEGEVVPLKELCERPEDFAPAHRLLLDRQKRELYICRTDHTVLFFAITEPKDEDSHSLYIDGMLMSPGTENYNAPPRKQLRAELLNWLDSQFPAFRSS